MRISFDADVVDIDDFPFGDPVFGVNDAFGRILREVRFDLNADVALGAVDVLQLAYGGVELVLIENFAGLVLNGQASAFRSRK